MTDVLILGGGVMGLAIALELRQAGLAVTLLSQNFAAAAAHAAAGMLAPQAEQIPPGPMLDLCLRSRDLYPDWVQKLEQFTGLDTGYWPCGILAPVYGALGATAAIQTGDTAAGAWCDRATLDQQYPGLGPEVTGALWYPQDAQIDNRALVKSLWMAVQAAGVDVREGVAAQALLQSQQQITGIQTAQGIWQAEHYVLATGAWSQGLLPIPVFPRKGQMLSVRVPEVEHLPLRTVLFGPEIYLVPRQDGRIVVGATSEDVGFTPHNTPAGIQALLTRAMRLFPALAALPLEEFWWGFRPATPDECPILGTSPYRNLSLATGHYRNGILLTPITAKFIADLVVHQTADPLLAAFHWSRFIP
jgi:glycine oxidase ThiO